MSSLLFVSILVKSQSHSWKQYQGSEIYSTEITHDPLLFSVAQGIFWLFTEKISRSTLHLKEGGEVESTLVPCNLELWRPASMPRCGQWQNPQGGTSTYILHLSGRDEQSLSFISRLSTRTSKLGQPDELYLNFIWDCVDILYLPTTTLVMNSLDATMASSLKTMKIIVN